MFRQVRMNISRLLAGFLAATMILSMVPAGIMFNVFAADVETFVVKLPENVAATVTMTDDNDAEKVFTADTNGDFEAVIEKLDDETTYTLVVSGMELYKSYTKTGVVADVAAPLEILATDLTEKEAQTITFAEDSITKTFGDESFVVTLSEAGLGTGAKAFSSTKETVAKVDSNGIVTITGAGTTEIKVSIAADENYKAAEDTLTLTVEKAENAISYVVTSVNWVFKDKKTNELTIKEGAIGSLTYASDNESVAKVDATTGEVTILSPGSANITATFVAEAGSNYKDSTATYAIEAIKKANALFYDNAEINATYGDGKGVNVISKPDDVTGAITYDSTNKNVATIDPASGEYTIVGAGTTTIIATLANDNGYADTTASYVLNVAKKENALSFELEKQTYTYGDDVNLNKLTVAFEELGGFTGTITYVSDASDVVSVDPSTGVITILKSGDATITASIAEENNYAATTASYTIRVEKKTITFSIEEAINYGDDDLDLAAQIRAGVIDNLATAEKDNADIITRVVNRISYKYPDVPAGELRQAGNYEIVFTTENDDCYAFNLSGSLKVKCDYEAKKDKEYTIVGLNDDAWGSVANKVIIKVTDESKYRISKTNNHSADWEETELVFDTAEDMNDHIFYIRDIQTNGKHKVSMPISETFGIDGTNPTVNYFDFKVTNTQAPIKVLHYLTFGLFFNEKVDVTVTASDIDYASGVDTITLFYNDDQYDEPKAVNGNMATFTLDVEKFATLKTISARGTDKVGNVSEMTYVTSGEGGNSNLNQAGNGMVQLEQIEAEIEVKYDNATSVDASNNKWYGNDIPFSVKVTDAGIENSGIRAVWATINGTNVEIADFTDAAGVAIKPYNNDADGIVSSKDAYYFIDKKTEVVNFTINTNLVTIPAKPDGKYVVEVFAVDNAGTQVKYGEEIIVNIDRDAPVITGFEFSATQGVEGNKKPAATIESYGYFFTEDTEVVVIAEDTRPSSGVKRIEFYTITNEGVRKDYEASSAFVDTSDADNVIVSATFKIPKGFKGQIYARAVDNVNHTTVNDDNTPKFFNPNGTAIEDAEMHKTHSEVTVTLVDDTTYTDSNNLPLYKWVADDSNETPDGIPVKLYVKDTFSGISSITWKVTAPNNATKEDPAGTTIVGNYLDGAVAVGDEIDGWTVESVDKNLVTEMSKIIYVTNNSNAIKVDLSFNDRALNLSEADPLYFSIDNTIPTIDVVYDNTTPDEEYTDFYKANRIATITITERNFRAKDVVFAITNTDEIIPTVDLTAEATWKLVENDDPDKTTHVATIEYAADGDYTFDISYKDNVENAAEAFAQHKFTIDKTPATIKVTYDNNFALNDKYFAKARVATIVIEEHNFDVNRVDFSALTASLNNNEIAKPEIKWVSEGNIHTATIEFTADGDYTFDVKATDMAGNESKATDYGSSVAAKDFVIDQTIVKPTIGGIKNGGAYKEKVVPTISFDDVNYDSYVIKLVRTRKGEKNVDVTKTFIKNINEQAQNISGSFNTFEEIVANDGIYTLSLKVKDKAGNEENEKYTFTVNRFGSVYEYSDELAALIKDGGQYIQSVDKDLVITEYNADKLLEGSLKILVTRDGETVDVDFTSTPEVNNAAAIGESGWYQYVYTIKAANFEKDGVYKISLASEYSADDSKKNESTSIPENSTMSNGDAIKDTMTFTVDAVAPEIRNIVNLDKKIADVDKIIDGKLNVKYTIVDVGGLKSVEIRLNGKTVQTITEKELAEAAFNYTGSFDISEQDGTTAQKIQIIVTDLAGNVTDTSSEDFLKAHSEDNENSTYLFFNEVTVSRNFFVRWYANTALFWGSIAGVVLLVGAVAFLIAKRKKKEETK